MKEECFESFEHECTTETSEQCKDVPQKVFPNQSEFGLESASCKIIFFFPNQTGISLENRTQFLGATFPNQIGFGLEKDTE